MNESCGVTLYSRSLQKLMRASRGRRLPLGYFSVIVLYRKLEVPVTGLVRLIGMTPSAVSYTVLRGRTIAGSIAGKNEKGLAEVLVDLLHDVACLGYCNLALS